MVRSCLFCIRYYFETVFRYCEGVSLITFMNNVASL